MRRKQGENWGQLIELYDPIFSWIPTPFIANAQGVGRVSDSVRVYRSDRRVGGCAQISIMSAGVTMVAIWMST